MPEGHSGLRLDIEAIGEAIKQGVTRSPDAGQGNGLAGALRIATLSGGSVRVVSGRGELKAKHPPDTPEYSDDDAGQVEYDEQEGYEPEGEGYEQQGQERGGYPDLYGLFRNQPRQQPPDDTAQRLERVEQHLAAEAQREEEALQAGYDDLIERWPQLGTDEGAAELLDLAPRVARQLGLPPEAARDPAFLEEVWTEMLGVPDPDSDEASFIRMAEQGSPNHIRWDD